MAAGRNRRYWIIAFIAAIPLEFVAASMLRYVPRIGVPKNPNPNLELVQDFSGRQEVVGLNMPNL